MALAGIIGRKLGMTQVYTPEGVLVPVTVIQAGPCTVVRARQPERDGYSAVQLGFGSRKAKRVSKADLGQVKPCGAGPFATVREIGLLDGEVPSVGTTVTVADVFVVGERVQVSGLSRGRGTSGVMRRHNFAGFPGSHGTHEYFRHGGSIGNRSFPGRVFKGKRMSGRWGADAVTISNLAVVAVRADEHLLLVRGAVPGARNGTVIIRKRQGARR